MRALLTLLKSPLHLILGLLLAFAFSAPALADDTADKAAIDKLFLELRQAPDAATAHTIDRKIWAYWTTPSDPDLRLRMLDVMEAMTMGDLQTLKDLLDALVVDYPAYAEGWNQRATLLYRVGDFEASIADCAKVLELEPRHFGALSGRAMMYLQMGKRSLALKDITDALAVHPFLAEKQLFPELQQEITRT